MSKQTKVHKLLSTIVTELNETEIDKLIKRLDDMAFDSYYKIMINNKEKNIRIRTIQENFASYQLLGMLTYKVHSIKKDITKRNLINDTKEM